MSGTPKLYEYHIYTCSHLFPHKQQELVSNLEQLGAGTGTTPSPKPPARNLLLETMGISYDMDEPLTNTVDATATPQLPDGPMPKEKDIRKCDSNATRKSHLVSSNVQPRLHNT